MCTASYSCECACWRVGRSNVITIQNYINHTKQYRNVQNYTKTYKNIQNNTKIKKVYKPYKNIQNYTKLHNRIQNYLKPYKTLQSCTILYKVTPTKIGHKKYCTLQTYTKHAVSALVVCMTGEVVPMAADRRSACSHLGKASYSKTDKFSEKFETFPFGNWTRTECILAHKKPSIENP